MSLHRYYCWTTLLKRDFEIALEKVGQQPNSPAHRGLILHKDLGMYMSYWYGALYVVCEGWQKLGLSDRLIDQLLESPNLKLLRRYRNGAFHFQKKYFDARFHKFMQEKSSVEWVRQISAAFGRWFLAYFAEKKKSEDIS